MTEWHPITTAPRDGTTLLVRVGEWEPYHASWQAWGWQPVEYDGSRWPTHWRPAQALKD